VGRSPRHRQPHPRRLPVLDGHAQSTTQLPKVSALTHLFVRFILVRDLPEDGQDVCAN